VVNFLDDDHLHMFTREIPVGLLSRNSATRRLKSFSCRPHHSYQWSQFALPANLGRKLSRRCAASEKHFTGLSFPSSIKTFTARMGSAARDMKAAAVFPAEETMFMRTPSRRSVVHSTKGMVACTQPLAAEAGQRILKMGGNAAVCHHIYR
jgi:hypothetical protein